MKKKNLIAICASALLIAAAVTACGGSTSETTAQAETEAEAADGEAGEAEAEGGEEAAADTIKVTFIATDTGLGDRSFNDSTWEGVQRAHDELGVEISIIEPDSVADMGTAIMTAVQSGSDLILGFGGSWADPLSEYCDRFPDVYFGGLNCNVTADNLQMAKTADHQGSFLAGALAATMTKTGTVACLGGQDADNINRFITGFEEGVKYVNPDVTVLKSYVGSYSDPALGKEYSLQLMNEGADIIFHIAGGTGEGLFEAARENENLYAIGVDSDQDYIAEGKVLTSVVKNCGNIAYEMIESVLNGTFETGDKVYDFENGGVCLTDMTYTKDLIGEDTIAMLDDLRQQIIDGEIVVTDLFEQ